MLFIYVSPVSMLFIYLFQFALLDNVQIISIQSFYPSTTGVFYILILSARCEILGMRSTHTPTSIFASPKFTHPYHPQNCTKFPHNSINHFDNHFDTHPKYPLTNTANKLSDKLKISQKLPNPSKTPHSHTHSHPLSNIQTIS